MNPEIVVYAYVQEVLDYGKAKGGELPLGDSLQASASYAAHMLSTPKDDAVRIQLLGAPQLQSDLYCAYKVLHAESPESGPEEPPEGYLKMMADALRRHLGMPKMKMSPGLVQLLALSEFLTPKG